MLVMILLIILFLLMLCMVISKKSCGCNEDFANKIRERYTEVTTAECTHGYPVFKVDDTYTFETTSYQGDTYATERLDTLKPRLKRLSLDREGDQGPINYYRHAPRGTISVVNGLPNCKQKLSVTNLPEGTPSPTASRNNSYKPSERLFSIIDTDSGHFYKKNGKGWVAGEDIPDGFFSPIGQNANLFDNEGFAAGKIEYTIPLVKAHLFPNLVQWYQSREKDTLPGFRDFNFAQLIKHGDPLPPASLDMDFVSYRFGDRYIPCTVMSDSGTGPFLEYHNFPHFISPLTGESRTIVILGKFMENDNNNTMAVTAFEVDTGYTLYIPPNVLHDDWYSYGDNLIALTDNADEIVAHSAFFRSKNFDVNDYPNSSVDLEYRPVKFHFVEQADILPPSFSRSDFCSLDSQDEIRTGTFNPSLHRIV